MNINVGIKKKKEGQKKCRGYAVKTLIFSLTQSAWDNKAHKDASSSNCDTYSEDTARKACYPTQGIRRLC